MKIDKNTLFVILLLASVLLLASCSGGKSKKSVSAEKPAATAQKKSIGQFLSALPCKLQGKKGVFAVFPDNPVAGQVCFSLSPLQGNKGDIPKFDIRNNGMHIIIHDTAGAATAAMKIVKLQNRGDQPCIEKSCVSEVAVSEETYNAPGEQGWSYIVLTPAESVDITSGAGGYYGAAVRTGAADIVYIPVFN
ncbi:MAG: hypothetical protein AB1546_12875 [bacterium]